MRVHFDLETTAQSDPATLAAICASIRPPGNLKKAESIAAWNTTERPAVEIEAIGKAGLSPETGQIISIAAVGDESHQVFARCRTQEESEAGLIADFFLSVERWQKLEADKLPPAAGAWPADPVYPIGHNLGGFDAPYLWKRCRILCVPTPDWLPAPGTRAGKYFGDTMTAWCGPAGFISLDRLCQLLSVASPKGGMTGAEVGQAWLDGRYTEIEEYNLRDVNATRAVWHRLHGGGA